jgi:hypothetical protein
VSIPTSMTQLLVVLVVIVPGFVYQGVRIKLRGQTPGDAELSTRIMTAIVASTMFGLAYAVAAGPTVVEAAQGQGEVLACPREYALAGLAAAFVIPSLTAVGWNALRNWERAQDWVEKIRPKRWTRVDPRPAGWDVAFQDRAPCHVRVMMRDGTWVAGWFGEDSYASGWPDPQTLFLQTIYAVEDDGTIGAQVEGSIGAVIDCREAVLVELLQPPEEASDASAH